MPTLQEEIKLANDKIAALERKLQDIEKQTIYIKGQPQIRASFGKIFDLNDNLNVIELLRKFIPIDDTDVASTVNLSHLAATVTDTASVDLSITGQDISAVVLPAGVNHALLANPNSTDIRHLTDAQLAALHARSHSIISTSDHTSAATNGTILKADANGLPVNSAFITEDTTGVGIGVGIPINNTVHIEGSLGVGLSSKIAIFQNRVIDTHNKSFDITLPASTVNNINERLRVLNNAQTITKLMITESASGSCIGAGDNTPVTKLHIYGNSDDDNTQCELRIEDADDTAGSQTPQITFYGANLRLGALRFNDVLGFQIRNIADGVNLSVTDAGVVKITNLTAGLVESSAAGVLSICTTTIVDIASAVSLKHARQHALDSTSDHTIGSLTSAYLIKSNGTIIVPSGFIAESASGVGIATIAALTKLHIYNATPFNLTGGAEAGQDNLFLVNDAGTGILGAIGGSICFNKPARSTNRGAAIASIMTGADIDQTGLAFYTAPLTTTAGDLQLSMTIDHAGVVTTNYGRIVKTIRVTSAPYAVLATDHHIFISAENCTINLPAGVAGTEYFIVNCSDTNSTITPNGTENLFGSDSYSLTTNEKIHIVYEPTVGWY